jgi:phospholipid/cholesterol/gamma-HCH transport system substrate-binding protein
VSRSLSRWQKVVLGIVVVTCLSAGAYGLLRLGSKSGMFQETFEVVVYVPDAQDVDKGTPVRIRGVEAGKVVAIEYPDAHEDAEDGMVRLRLEVDHKFHDRLFADASAAIVSKGLVGSTHIAMHPGKPSAGPLNTRVIVAKKQPDLTEVTAKLSAVATRVDNVLKKIEKGEGTAGKLVNDDSLYSDLKSITADFKKLVKNSDETVVTLRGESQSTMYNAQKAIDSMNVTLIAVQNEVAGLKDIVRTSKEALSAIKQDAEAVKSLPIIRNYVQDEVKQLVRPHCKKDKVVYRQDDLFEPGRAALTGDGRNRVGEVAAWLRGRKDKGSEIVVASFQDPNDKNETSASARELTRKRSEVVVGLLKEWGAAKISTLSSRNIVALGLGFEPTPLVEHVDFPSRTEIILFVPQ